MPRPGHAAGGRGLATLSIVRTSPAGEPALSRTDGPPAGGPAGDQVEVLLHRLDPELAAPAYAHPGDAGADLLTAVDVTLAPGERTTVPTGVAIALPTGFAGFVHPRSGLAARSGLTVVNAPGTVDAGYRGEIRVTLLNTDASTPVLLRRGDRIAQLVVQRVSRARFVEVDALPRSPRGTGGFGSTGGFGGSELSVRGSAAANGSAAPEQGEI
jgi:dUTP pyrophosphatase